MEPNDLRPDDVSTSKITSRHCSSNKQRSNQEAMNDDDLGLLLTHRSSSSFRRKKQLAIVKEKVSSSKNETAPIAASPSKILKKMFSYQKNRKFLINQKSSNTKKLLITTFTTTILILMLTVTYLNQIQLVSSTMCQHHQAMLEQAAMIARASSSQQTEHSNNNINLNNNNQQLFPKSPEGSQNLLLICPRSSQHNNLPQFPSKYTSPKLEWQQSELLKQLNESFINHLQLNGKIFDEPSMLPSASVVSSSAASTLAPQDQPLANSNLALPNELIDDELLNEIISPLMVDDAYMRAKEAIVKRRKLENELVKQG